MDAELHDPFREIYFLNTCSKKKAGQKRDIMKSYFRFIIPKLVGVL